MGTKSPDIFGLSESLTAAQKLFFAQNGFLHFQQFLNPLMVQQALDAMAELEREWLQQGKTHIYGVPLRMGFDIDGSPIIQRFAFASLYHEKLQTIIADPRLKALLCLLGPGARLGEREKDGMVINHYVNVPGSGFCRLGWHTDSIRDLFLGGKVFPMLNIGIHLDDCPMNMGGLRVLPGTHEQNTLGMLFRKRYFLQHKADRKEVGFDVRAGDLTIHDGRLWHRVAQAPTVGEASRRRVIYIPIISGKYSPKHPESTTPLYHKLHTLIK